MGCLRKQESPRILITGAQRQASGVGDRARGALWSAGTPSERPQRGALLNNHLQLAGVSLPTQRTTPGEALSVLVIFLYGTLVLASGDRGTSSSARGLVRGSGAMPAARSASTRLRAGGTSSLTTAPTRGSSYRSMSFELPQCPRTTPRTGNTDVEASSSSRLEIVESSDTRLLHAKTHRGLTPPVSVRPPAATISTR